MRICAQRSASGSGTATSLWHAEDSYSAIAKQLSMDGFASHAIQSILDALGNESASAVFAIVSSGRDVTMRWKRWIKPNVQVVSSAELQKKGWSLVTDCANDLMGCYVLNIRGIVSAVELRVQGASVRSRSAIRTAKKRKEEPSRPGRIFLKQP